MELGKKKNNRDSLLPLIILHTRQTDIRGPLHRADDSCKHVEVAVSEVDYAYACAPDCCCWPLLARVVFSSSGVRAAQLHRVCEFSALWVSATHPTPHHPSTRASRPDHNGVQSNHLTPNFSACPCLYTLPRHHRRLLLLSKVVSQFPAAAIAQLYRSHSSAPPFPAARKCLPHPSTPSKSPRPGTAKCPRSRSQ